jgi:hypothetical protein
MVLLFGRSTKLSRPGKLIVRKDPDTGAVKIWRASVEKNPKDSEFEPPFNPAA